MKYKAIILDVDDTTVVHGKTNLPSEAVTRAIRQAKERIHVCVATARPLSEALTILSHLELSGPCIIGNGTQIYNPVEKKVISDVPLPNDVVPAIYEICKKYNLRALLYNGLVDSKYDGGMITNSILGVYLPEVDPAIVDKVIKRMQKTPGVNVQKLSAWNKQFMSIDVTHSKASKLHGIIKVADILHITTDEIIGVGDGYNDFSLLMACGLKIAMGNAVPELKAIADFVAPSVYDDGVATVIEKFVLTS